MDAIKTDNLTKTYGKSRGITELSLQVEKGDFFGFMGPNGAGKSTTIRTLLGLMSPTSGTARILGMDIQKNSRDILSRTGYLPSEAFFYSGMKVKDVLRLSADLRKTDCRNEAEILCSRLQLDVNRKISELSFGNRKKAAIICALQHKPELLILDEPTGGLDPLMQREFFEILRERNSEGTTIFFSSHILSEVQRNCSRAAIIREGKIIAEGTVEELSRTNARAVNLQGSADVSGLKGVKNLSVSGSSMSFLYSGSMNELMACLSNGNIKDISIAEPDLEEVFLHYYQEGGETK